MAGFSNDTMFADNVDFSGGKSPTVTLDGQLLIGSTVAPNIRVSTLTAGAGIGIANGAGTVTISSAAGGAGVDTINGVLPVLNNIDIVANQIAAVPQGIVITVPSTQGPANTIGVSALFDGVTIVLNGAGQLVSTAAPLVWTDIAIATLATPFSGWFATAALTLTLPAGAGQGDLVVLDSATAGAVVIQANAGQFLQVAGTTSIVAGTATTTSIGDSLTFVFRAATTTWCATSVVGNWFVV